MNLFSLRHAAVLAVAASIAALTLSACGGDDDGNDDSATTGDGH